MRGRFFTPTLLKQLAAVDAPGSPLAFARADAETVGPTHDPTLAPRDEGVFLLTVVAEIEHALMVQYLYAAYSVRSPGGDTIELDEIQHLLLQIAREEMGHLATVQNLLHLIGGPLNFNREHSAYASELYPFRFKLEPLTLDSLAKYVIAESPEVPPDRLPEKERALLEQLKVDAMRSNGGRPVHHVGPFFTRLQQLFEGGDDGLADEDFRLDRHSLQAKAKDWGFEPASETMGESLIVESFGQFDVAAVRSAAVAAVGKIGAQGEGFDLPTGPDEPESHFERFLHIYKLVRDLSEQAIQITWPMTENPNTSHPPLRQPDLMRMVEVVEEAYAAKGRITHPRARAWAHLFNLRYRLLLGYLSHFLRLRQELYVAGPGPRRGDPTSRGLLLIWTFNEMRHLKKIAGKLVQLPRDDPPAVTRAGPPFELPYTLNLPEREEDRWRVHLDVSRASVRLVRERLQSADATDQQDGFLADLVAMDEKAHVIMESLAAGAAVPEGSLPADFKKAVLILDEAVRGFDIGFHGRFWADQTRNQFLTTRTPKGVPVEPDGQGGFDPDRSALIMDIEGTIPGQARMPRFRPPVPPERIGFLRDWIQAGAPDSVPPDEVGIRRERTPTPEPVVATPPTPTTLSFAADIKPLFRERPDREAMLVFGPFDLHRFEDVRDNADGILAVLKEGSMPCDDPWPPDRVATFRKWIDDGKRP
jgi:rubrerythrin